MNIKEKISKELSLGLNNEELNEIITNNIFKLCQLEKVKLLDEIIDESVSLNSKIVLEIISKKKSIENDCL